MVSINRPGYLIPSDSLLLAYMKPSSGKLYLDIFYWKRGCDFINAGDVKISNYQAAMLTLGTVLMPVI